MTLKEIREIGSGAYGSIVLVEDLQDGEYYVIKKTKIGYNPNDTERVGVDFTSIREIKILREL